MRLLIQKIGYGSATFSQGNMGKQTLYNVLMIFEHVLRGGKLCFSIVSELF